MAGDRLYRADNLGAVNAGAFDLSAACSGFLYALAMGVDRIMAGNAKKVLVIGAEVFSRIVDWNDRNTCVLFGDGAGAVVIETTLGRSSESSSSRTPRRLMAYSLLNSRLLNVQRPGLNV